MDFLKFEYRRALLLGVMALSFSACGNSPAELPDDPTNEVIQNPAPSVEIEGFKDSVPSDLSKYSYVDPTHMIQEKHLTAALNYYETNKAQLGNSSYLSIIDFSKSSKEKRFFIINMSTGSVWAIHVAHGKGSDSDHDGIAEKFSNVSGSNASSLGFYLTAETYNGSNGYSLRLDGLSSTNSNVRARAIVIHGASYVQESSVIQGRSWGCPAVAVELRDKVISLLKGGSLIYAGI
jgi:hypothetical protein